MKIAASILAAMIGLWLGAVAHRISDSKRIDCRIHTSPDNCICVDANWLERNDYFFCSGSGRIILPPKKPYKQ